jgi:hypothetical protein
MRAVLRLWYRRGAPFDQENLKRQYGIMLVLVLGMLLIVGIAVAVVSVVAVPARRQGRDVLTPRGEEVVSLVREKTGSVVEAAREKGGEALDAAREKVTKPTQD